MSLKRKLSQLDSRPDKDDILRRANYYCKLTPESVYDKAAWEEKAVELRHQPMTPQKVYYFDAMEIARYFNQSLRWILKSGDVINLFPVPTVVKSRPLGDDNQNSVILKLEKNRHFLFVNDKKPWREKKNVAIFRGDLGTGKKHRDVFMEKFADGQSPLVDAASTRGLCPSANFAMNMSRFSLRGPKSPRKMVIFFFSLQFFLSSTKRK